MDHSSQPLWFAGKNNRVCRSSTAAKIRFSALNGRAKVYRHTAVPSGVGLRVNRAVQFPPQPLRCTYTTSVGGALDLLTFSPPGLSSLVGGKFFRPKIRIGLATTLTDPISKCLATASWGARNSSVSWRQATSSRSAGGHETPRHFGGRLRRHVQLGSTELLDNLATSYVVTTSWGATHSSASWRQTVYRTRWASQHFGGKLRRRVQLGSTELLGILATSYVVFSWGTRHSSAPPALVLSAN